MLCSSHGWLSVVVSPTLPRRRIAKPPEEFVDIVNFMNFTARGRCGFALADAMRYLTADQFKLMKFHNIRRIAC
jgi:hypothetical protein